MRKVILFYIIYLLICVTILFIPTSIEPYGSYADINHIVNTAKDNWKEIQEGRLKKILNIKSDFIIIDNYNNVLLRSADSFEFDTNMYTHIKNKDNIVEIFNNNGVVGKVIIKNNDNIIYKNRYRQIKIYCFTVMITAAVILGIFLFMLWRRVLNPIDEIKDSLENIVQGNLERPLVINCSGIMKDFANSFNILRENLLIAKNDEILLKKKNKELIASLSHDIKTPVASIKAVAELLSVQEDDDIKRNKLFNIIVKTEQINLLTNNLLQTTLEEIKDWEVYMSEESSEIISDIIRSSDYKNHVLPFFIEPCLIRVDKNKAVQVFDNIINNSYKYADTPIKVSTRFVDKYLEISIADFGNTISNEDIELITQKFYRGKNAKGYIGTGLGLYISNDIMNKMGGELVAKKENGKFCINLYILLA